jgi:hypothetical protein
VRIEVLNADDEKAPPIAIFDAAQLQTMLQPTGRDVPAPARTSLDSGESAIVFMEVQSPRKASLPSRIAHRVVTEDAAVQGAVAETRHTHLNLLAAPLHGENWLAADGPSNSEENHHRRGTILLDGNSVDSRRFAIDWKRVKGGVSYSGDKHDVHSYYSYAQPVFAVADGRVQTAREGMPDNVPGHGADFHSAVPLNLENVSGNTITLDLGDGQFAYYMHLQPGTLRVKAGDLVKKGQLLAAIGASGDAREPHLHFEVTTSPKLLRGEGVPYVLEHYRINADTNNSITIHEQELPLDVDIVSFER